MENIDTQTVLEIAKLCHLKIQEGTEEAYVHDLAEIVKAISSLFNVDTKGVEPVVNVNAGAVRVTQDKVSDGNCVEDVLKNSPQSKFNHFTVPKVVE